MSLSRNDVQLRYKRKIVCTLLFIHYGYVVCPVASNGTRCVVRLDKERPPSARKSTHRDFKLPQDIHLEHRRCSCFGRRQLRLYC
ncbi:hypothetical protein BIW11_03341 [Tropilaelaps mercedesae]|uniref:Uncharacterized protein n=1 Tax=Tropilaelaps mercedesae TaxID=418985 RepID=A0A1V9XN09_9ACAR|nr:hypothetical protein BIW11_03341 [Tropilaelaps mercedesae]